MPPAAAAAATHLFSAMWSPPHIFSSVLVLQALLVAVIADSVKESPALQRSDVCPVVLPQPPATTKIIAGDPVSPLLRPYVAVLLVVDRTTGAQSLCTATPVTKRYLITAAHCAPIRASSANTYAGFNLDSISSADSISQQVRVRRWNPHPEYEDNSDGSRFDIAVVELEDDLEFEGSGARTMPVNVAENIPLEASFARVAGFGVTASESSGVLRQVDMPIISNEDCEEAYANILPTDRDYHICAGYLEKGRCSGCSGDSGGPLIQYDKNNNPVLVGVVSRGTPDCGAPGAPSVFIRTSKFREWLDDQIEEDYVKATAVRAVFEDGSTIDVSGSGGGLSGGAIAGIVIGVLVAVAAVVALAFYFFFFFVRKRAFAKEDKFGGAAPPPPSTTPGVPAPYLQPWQSPPPQSPANLGVSSPGYQVTGTGPQPQPPLEPQPQPQPPPPQQTLPPRASTAIPGVPLVPVISPSAYPQFPPSSQPTTSTPYQPSP